MKKVRKALRLAQYATGLLLFLGGCYNYKAVPPGVESDSYTMSKDEKPVRLPEACKILTLDEACRLAEENNPDYISKHHAMQAAWSRYYQSMSSYFPTVTGRYGITETNQYPANMTNVSYNQTNDFNQNMGVNAQWVIFNGLVREMNMLIAKHNAKSSEYIEEDTRRLLIKSVANQYNSVLLAIEKNRIAMTNKDFQSKLLKETKLKYEAGAVPLSDVLNFEVKLNEAESSEIIAQYEYDTARHALGALMGLTEGTVPSNVKYPPMSTSTEVYLADVEVYLDTALANRPDLKQYRELLLASKYSLYAAYGAFSPTVTATADYGYTFDRQNVSGRNGNTLNGDSSWDTKYNNGAMMYGGNVSWTLFQGGYRYNKVMEAKATLAQSEFELAKKWIGVISEVRSAHDNYVQNIKQANLYKRTLGLVTQQRDLVEEEYKAGNVELTRLNEAQRDLVNADTNLVSALINVENAKAQLEAATNTK